MNQISEILYWISTGLLIPVLILLILFFLRSLILIGTFYGMYIHKMRFNKKFRDRIATLSRENVRQVLGEFPSGGKLLLSEFIGKVRDSKSERVYYEKLLSDFEVACQKDLSMSQTLAKVGPILGLMGTLIPMGPALVGLASGDISSMAMNMQVAFATTVIGLLSGAVGFVVTQVKRRWYTADVNNLDFIVELLMDQKQ
ncbi:MAG: hypothetical protein CSA95_08375 [Bacteroidetes bacterium]|nr:MAG: hypothetical protein CSA95_08375 [Bacteroidota bacterium]PIE88338.1 MAG: hypothetical protein CSA04_02370 [Bacteroidota bacterium]